MAEGLLVSDQVAQDAAQQAQVDEQVDQGVLVGNGCAVTQMRALDAQIHGLTVDAFGGGTLAIDFLIGLALPIQGVAQAGADTGGQVGRTATLRPVAVIEGAGLSGGMWEEQGAGILAALVFDDGAGAVGKGQLERHG